MPEAATSGFDHPDAGFNAVPGWTWVGTYGGYYLQCDLLNGFEHGFFTRLWQGREPHELAGFLSAGVSVHRPRQVHGGLVLPASAAKGEPWPEADGLHSDAAGQSLWVCGADCTPVLIVDPRQGHVATCHAGWRGVAARIVPTAVQHLETLGSRRQDLLVALGPAISGANYQVERGVSVQVAQSLNATSDNDGTAGLESLIEAGALQPDPKPGHDRLDIRLATTVQLDRFGITADRISICPVCTAADGDRFQSWRRDQKRAVQWSGVVSQA